MTSLIEQLREKRRAAAGNITVDLPIPGYRGSVVGRYRLVDPLVEGKEIGDRVRAQFDDDRAREHYAFVDTLIAACQGLYLRTETGELEPIDPDGQGPARYDARLADALGIQAGSSRDVLDALFNGNKVAIDTHALRLAQWMADPSRDPGEA